MKIVAIADTHGMHQNLQIPNGDVFIHAGDFLRTGRLEEIHAFNNWLSTLPHKYKIVIAGNHDRCFENIPALSKQLLTNAIYLQDQTIVINDTKFYGSPWQPEFNNWAFNLPRNGPELAHKWSLIPDDVHVLITHGPPYNILDQENNVHLGCEKLLDRIKRIQPPIHIFGHIHGGYGHAVYNNIDCYNVSICTPKYEPINSPITIMR